jgi:hypothetical protein
MDDGVCRAQTRRARKQHNQNQIANSMKNLLISLLIGLASMTLLTGCLDLHLGGGSTSYTRSSTAGQQLIDLQKAKDAGIITDAEYQAQKARVLGNH